jgi:hypothetical protein
MHCTSVTFGARYLALGVWGLAVGACLAMDADQPVLTLQTMVALMNERTSGIGMIARMLLVMVVIAFGLAIMGLYSLMTFIVSRRTQELGVGLALGASRWQVIAVTIRHGALITASACWSAPPRRTRWAK